MAFKNEGARAPAFFDNDDCHVMGSFDAMHNTMWFFWAMSCERKAFARNCEFKNQFTHVLLGKLAILLEPRPNLKPETAQTYKKSIWDVRWREAFVTHMVFSPTRV